MLNKELLLVNPDEGLAFTHTITVGRSPASSLGFGDPEITYPPYGKITPSTFDVSGDNLDILEVSSYEFGDTSSYFRVSGFLGISYLYIGRTDTRRVITFDHIAESEGEAVANNILFTTADVGKNIDLWIGETPPPWA